MKQALGGKCTLRYYCLLTPYSQSMDLVYGGDRGERPSEIMRVRLWGMMGSVKTTEITFFHVG